MTDEHDFILIREWNAAIEAAARIAEKEGKIFVAREIRKLKK